MPTANAGGGGVCSSSRPNARLQTARYVQTNDGRTRGMHVSTRPPRGRYASGAIRPLHRPRLPYVNVRLFVVPHSVHHRTQSAGRLPHFRRLPLRVDGDNLQGGSRYAAARQRRFAELRYGGNAEGAFRLKIWYPKGSLGSNIRGSC
jgi:hypothetical protein